jgi:hypothetical protein
MITLHIPISGLMLIAHLAAYGFGATLEAGGERAFVAYDPDSLDLQPLVGADASLERVLECIRRSAVDCEDVVEADEVPGKTGNDRRSVIWARSTAGERARRVLPVREQLLDHAEASGRMLSAALCAGLGAPAAWLVDRPHTGASQLDGVLGNHTSDFVRGVLRRWRPVAETLTADQVRTLFTTIDPPPASDEDKTGWSPPGSRVHGLCQWLAAIGLSQLPVGLSATGPSRTPCFRRNGGDRAVRLPVLGAPTSLARLRALLQLPELVASELTPAMAARIRALGVSELIDFPRLDHAGQSSVAFSFARATRVEL